VFGVSIIPPSFPLSLSLSLSVSLSLSHSLIEVKYVGMILSPNLMDLVVLLYLYGRFDA
jgi:hypothetical protein